jgi:CRP-like cAMP-binding protein
VRRLGPGDSFGEIALLERGPRTATVTTVAPSRMLVIDRDGFVTSVTGHRPTDDLARAVVATLHEDDEHRADQRGEEPRSDEVVGFPRSVGPDPPGVGSDAGERTR